MSTIVLPTPRMTADAGLAAAHGFLAEHGDALCSASLLLGGPAAERRYLALFSGLSEARALRRHHLRKLIEAHRLLTLQHVGDPDREETALFAKIDPADPRVHDLCRLADRLRDLLIEIAAAQEAGAAPPELIEHIAA